jgi:hypothetical protein
LSKHHLQKLQLKQIPNSCCYILKHPIMTKPANASDKPSPSDTPTHRPEDNGNKTVRHESDKEYTEDEPHGGDVAKKREKEEQPTSPVKDAPAGKGAQHGKVQP